MKSKSYEINMTEGSVLKKIILFTFPLILGNLLQLLYNAADLIVVSRWTGSNAMASVGATASVSSLITNLCIGLSVGASILVSRCFGAGDDEGVHKSVHTAMCVSAIGGVITMLLGILTARPLLTFMGTPSGAVLEGAVLYMTITYIALPGTMVYNFGAAIMRAVGDTKRPLYILSATGIINVILNLVFVVVFKWGVAGVAVSTGIANWLSAAVVVYFLAKSNSAYKLVLSKLKIYKEELREILRIGIPAGVQSSMFAIANTVIQSSVNSFGAAAMAGKAAGGSIEGFVYTAMNAFQVATVTAISQNIGAKKMDRVRESLVKSLICVSVVGIVLGTLAIVFKNYLLGIYITDSAEAMHYGDLFLLYTCFPYFLCGIMEVLAGALRGMGYSGFSALASLIGVCGFRLAWVMFVLPLHKTFVMLMICWPISWALVSVVYLIGYLKAKEEVKIRMNQI